MTLGIVTNDPKIIEKLDQLVDPNLDYSGSDYDNYWCISITPFKCGGCGSMVEHAQCGNHLIVIWEEKDSDGILEVADALKDDYDARIVRYNRNLGPCIDYEEAIKRGMIETITHGA
jgi:hypothetical protein